MNELLKATHVKDLLKDQLLFTHKPSHLTRFVCFNMTALNLVSETLLKKDMIQRQIIVRKIFVLLSMNSYSELHSLYIIAINYG